MKVYNVSFSHQIEPEDYGMYNSLDKAKELLRTMGVDLTKEQSFYNGKILIYGDYRIEEKYVK